MKQRENLRVKGEWFDNHAWVPIVFLILLPFLVHLPLLCLGLTTDPLYLGADVGSHPLTGYSSIGINPKATTIDGNIGSQLQALGHLSASEWLHGRVPWWNHYSGIGLPLAGDMQPASFFLPFIFLLLLKNGILWLGIAMQILAGLATFALLRTLSLGRLAALTGGALFSLNGTFALLSGMVGNTIPFLPLLIYGVELAYRDGTREKGTLWIGISLFGSLAAGFPESAYINGLLALTWTVYRVTGSSSRPAFIKAVIYGGVLGLMISSPLLVAFFDYIKTTDIVALHKTDHVALLPPVLANIFLPFLFGSIYYAPAPNWNVLLFWGSNGGYESIVIAFVALLALQAKKERGLRWLLFFWIIVCMAASFGIAPFRNIAYKLPFMGDVNLSRYSSPTWEFAFTVLAAMALDDLRYTPVSKRLALAITTIVIAACIVFAWPESKYWDWRPHEARIMKSLMCGVLALVLVSLAVVGAILHFGKEEGRRYGVSILLIFSAAWTFMIPETAALKSESNDLSSINYIQKHLGLSRFVSLGPIQPNYSAYFQIPNINYTYCPVPQNWVSYVSNSLFPDAAKTAGGTFASEGWFSYSPNDGQVALSKHGDNYKQAAVRYIVSHPGEGILPLISLRQKDFGKSQLVLMPKQSVSSSFKVPLENENSYPVSMVGVSQAQSSRRETMIGDVRVFACTGQGQCVTGQVSLAFSHPGQPIWIPLDGRLNVRSGDQVTISLRYLSGAANLVISMLSGASLEASSMTPLGRINNETMQLELAYGDGMSVKPVHSDSAMDIWELPDASPYYSIVNGSCILSNENLDSIDAECTSPATLLRRELYMEGWLAQVNGSSRPVTAVNNLFQSIELQEGRNAVRFRFSPPYVQYAWPLFSLGLLGLILELWKCRRRVDEHV